MIEKALSQHEESLEADVARVQSRFSETTAQLTVIVDTDTGQQDFEVAEDEDVHSATKIRLEIRGKVKIVYGNERVGEGCSFKELGIVDGGRLSVSMPRPVLVQLYDMFRWFDCDGSGFIDIREYKARRAEADMTVGNEDLKSIICHADIAGSGTIDFSEMVLAVLNQPLDDRDNRDRDRVVKSRGDWIGVYEAVTGDVIDIDEFQGQLHNVYYWFECIPDGHHINIREYKTRREEAGMVVPAGDLSRIFSNADRNGNGLISFRELMFAILDPEMRRDWLGVYCAATGMSVDIEGAMSAEEMAEVEEKKVVREQEDRESLTEGAARAVATFDQVKQALGDAAISKIEQMFAWYSEGDDAINPRQFRNAVEQAGGSFSDVRHLYTDTDCMTEGENAGNGTIELEELVLALASGRKDLQECWLAPYTHATGRSIHISAS